MRTHPVVEKRRTNLFAVFVCIALLVQSFVSASPLEEYRFSPGMAEETGFIVRMSRNKEGFSFKVIIPPFDGFKASDWKAAVWVYEGTNLVMTCNPEGKQVTKKTTELPDWIKGECLMYECSVAADKTAWTRFSLTTTRDGRTYRYWMHLDEYQKFYVK